VFNAAGDIFLLDERDIIHTNLSVREGLGEQWGKAAVVRAAPRAVSVVTECGSRAPPTPPLAEIVVSVGMALPPALSAISRRSM
jgi:hypothetical protein